MPPKMCTRSEWDKSAEHPTPVGRGYLLYIKSVTDRITLMLQKMIISITPIHNLHEAAPYFYFYKEQRDSLFSGREYYTVCSCAKLYIATTKESTVTSANLEIAVAERAIQQEHKT